ncbi:uncharacterized protein LOC111829970 [Capsella rubella]|uniref:uncharacterized protein LOC111829970 n=1 Tax=Capsella rubella TaxID=81985 RepID=UPI000CD5386B|nr:uncharacterized protein LOC111829970 [Capsella rubella]
METEAYILMDEAHSRSNIVGRTEPEIEVGFPNICYCGGQPLLQTSYTRNDPGRKYFTCENVSDGDMHIHKWWDVAVMEEIRERARVYEVDLKEHREQESITEEKIVKLEKLVAELQKSKLDEGYELLIGGGTITVFVLFLSILLYCRSDYV